MNYKKLPTLSYVDGQQKLYPQIKIKTLSFQITEDCCLQCTYCYQHNKSKTKMTFDVAKQFIDNLLNNKISNYTTENTDGLIIDFIGGEPLLEIELIEQIWEYLILNLIEKNHPWQYHIRGSMCSNGVLYFEEKVQNFFKKYGSMFSFCVSIDGNKELHDSCRIDFNGNGSYDRAIAAARHYREFYDYELETKMTLAPSNVHYTYNAIINLIQEKYTSINLNCAFEPGWQLSHAQILYAQLIELADYIIDNDLYDKVYVSMFEEGNFKPMDPNDNINWCGGAGECIQMMALSPTGVYYPCIRYMESSLGKNQKPLQLGNIYTGYLNTDEEKENYQLVYTITRRSQSTDECFYCPIAKGCSWCSAYNYEEFGTPNKRATHICIMHKARALANVYYWNKLYKKLNIDKTFVNYLPEEDIKMIIGEGELKQYEQL